MGNPNPNLHPISNPNPNPEDAAALKPMHDVSKQVPFLGPILQVRERETEGFMVTVK
jgi:hypothetical protein